MKKLTLTLVLLLFGAFTTRAQTVTFNAGSFGRPSSSGQAGTLTFAGFSPSPRTLSNGSTLFSVNFEAVGTGTTPVAFGDDPTAQNVEVNNSPANFASNDGSVTVVPSATVQPGELIITELMPDPDDVTSDDDGAARQLLRVLREPRRPHQRRGGLRLRLSGWLLAQQQR